MFYLIFQRGTSNFDTNLTGKIICFCIMQGATRCWDFYATESLFSVWIMTNYYLSNVGNMSVGILEKKKIKLVIKRYKA